MSNAPQRITSMCSFVWLRADLPRAAGQAYWRGAHAQIANKVAAMREYLQHHFSDTGHGFWPVPAGVGGTIPPDWRIDGLTEVRINSLAVAILDRLFRMKAIFHDEFNVFDRVLANNTPPSGGLWWTGPYKPETGFRAAVLIRARHEMRGTPFRRFIEKTLAPALMEAGVSELRTHVFAPGGRFTHWTPDVLHDQPANRSYAAALLIGARSRAELEQLLSSPLLQATQAEQHQHCIAIHAYAVENTYPCVLDDEPQPSSWG